MRLARVLLLAAGALALACLAAVVWTLPWPRDKQLGTSELTVVEPAPLRLWPPPLKLVETGPYRDLGQLAWTGSEHPHIKALLASFAPSRCAAPPALGARLEIDDPHAPLGGPASDESFNVTVGDSVTVRAKTLWGALRALVTLRRLGPCVPELELSDAPRFAHRGVMLDPARNFLPLPLLEKVLDGMQRLHLNVLHLDLVNAPSFPFASPSHPEFAKAAAYSPSEQYTAAELAALVATAASKGIRVLLEVDTPGHSYSWGAARPDLVKCSGLADQLGANCPEPPCGYLDLASAEARSIVQAVVRDALAIARGAGARPFVHLGADEVSDHCFGSGTKALFRSWVAGVANATQANGTKHHVWMEAWSAMGAPLETASTVLQFWGNAATWDGSNDKAAQIAEQHAQLAKALDAGYSVVYSNASAWYLDCGVGNFVTGGLSWCGPYKSWQAVLADEPYQGVKAEQRKQLIGGEVALWGEQTDATNLEPKLWQRAAAAAARLWAGEQQLAGCTGALPSLPLGGCWKQAQDALRQYEEEFQQAGFLFGPSQPQFCRQSPGVCDAYH